ncbi:g- coupled receptor [Fusarium longipes]|uniref:G-coupled receptor n=1 Tax=Fusarium longipes TaxID=694270 RepID=A0A395SSX8_9HYPO|nr:g- coupled receptor [Fusarium longipes]
MTQQQPQADSDHVLKTPVWILIIRIFQFLVSLVIVGLCGWMIHDAGLPENSLSIAIAVITWIVVLYAVLTEKLPALRSLYHIIAVLCLDGLMLVLWLAAWAATAARRAKYVVPVAVGGCYDDGSLIDSKNCSVFYKRDGENVILFKTGLATLAAIAGLGALVWVLFIVTFVWSLVMFLQGRKQGRFAVDLSGPTNNYQMEPKTEAQVNVQPQNVQPAPQYQQQQAPPAQYAPQQQQQQQQFPPQTTPSPYQPTQSPYQQQGAYSPPPVSPYDPQQGQQQFQGQQNYVQHPPQQYHEVPGSTSPPPPQQPYPAHGHPQ